ncbi:hypothetical protein LTS15_007614 [Exophiala xenobiotica]|nr:hypothetical protein LTS15_007614 [Exophiala xenobiotica]
MAWSLFVIQNGTSLPLDGLVDKGGKNKPEYTRYRSIQHFFNEKRQKLLESVPSTYSFNRRVVPETRGQLIQPIPPGISRNALTDVDAIQKQKLKFSRKEAKREHNPRYCLGRYQLLSMWNADLVTKEQEDDSDRAMEKMRVLQRRYRLREYDPKEREAQANRGADGKKKKTTEQWEAGSRKGASWEKRKMDNSEGGNHHGTTTLSAQGNGLDLKDEVVCEAQGGADKKSPSRKQDANNVEAASSDAEVKMSAEVSSSKSKKKKGKAPLSAQNEAKMTRLFRVAQVDAVRARHLIWNTKIPARRRSLKRKRNACEEIQLEEQEPPNKKQKLGHIKSRRGRVSMVSPRNPSMSLAARYIASPSCAQPSSPRQSEPPNYPPPAIERPVVQSKISCVSQMVQKLEEKVQDSKEKENLPNPE